MTRTLHRQLPLVPTFGWRSRGGRGDRDGSHTPTGQLRETVVRRLLKMRANVGLQDPAMRLSEGGLPEETEDGEGPVGDLPGYVPTGEERCIKEVYGYWVHSNDGAHLTGGVATDQEWQAILRILVVMPTRRYNAPSRRVGRRFVQALSAELMGGRQRHWNAERFLSSIQ